MTGFARPWLDLMLDLGLAGLRPTPQECLRDGGGVTDLNGLKWTKESIHFPFVKVFK